MIDSPKFIREFTLQVQSNRGDARDIYTISSPITLEFSISRNVMAEANYAKLTLFNLAPDTRAAIYHDRMRVTPSAYQKVTLIAGYASSRQKSLLFLGNVMTASSQRQGPDWKTSIDAFDGGMGFVSGQVSLTVPVGASPATVAKMLTNSMDFVSYGAVGDVKFKNSRPMAMSGSAYEIAQRLYQNSNFFIDNGMTFILNDNEYVVRPGEADLILNSNNIIGSPRRQEGWIDVDVIFEPGAYPAQRAFLSSRDGVYNGQYQVRGIKHNGTISGSVCDKAITTLSLWSGNTTLTPVYL